MNKSLEIKNRIVLLLLLLCVGMQVKAQQATRVEVFREDFERKTFSGDFISAKPTGSGFEFLNDIDFIYYTDPDGQVADLGYSHQGYCIIATNSNKIGHGDWSHPAMGTYCFYGVSDGTARKVYTKTVSATKGEQVEFGINYRDVDGSFSFRIEATGDGLSGNTTMRSDEFYRSGGEWNQYTYSVTATATGNITFNVIDRYDVGNRHKFGMDNITITKKAINITQPTTAVRCAPGTPVSLEAKYEQVNEGYSYAWQKYDGSSWGSATAATGVATDSGMTNSLTTAISVTEATAGIYNYRLAVTDADSKTYYSDIITVEYTSTSYIFREDFGGNFPSTESIDQGVSGASGDWWLMPGEQPTIITDFTYGEQDNTDHDNRGLAEKVYGRIPIKLDYGGEARYAITKIAGYNLPLPGYEDKTWKWGDESPGDKGAFYDHTLPGEKARGYYMYAANRTNQEKIIYQTTLSATGMAGKAFKLSAWQVAVWGNQDKKQFKLEVLNASNIVIKTETFNVTDDWQERSLFFYLPTDYTGANITLRISSFDSNNLWLGLDDISLVEEEVRLDIILPESNSTVGTATDFVVSYKYISSSPIYKWQRSADGNTGWVDIAGINGSLNSDNGTFITEVPVTDSGYYYRVLMAESADTNYAKPIISGKVKLNKSTEYYFIEDFGGAAASTTTDPLTKDWWKTQAEGAEAKLPQLYGSDYLYTEDVDWIDESDKSDHPRGMDKTLFLFNDRFAITKVSGKMAEVKYENGQAIPIMLAGQKTLFDHTDPAEGIGYYMLTRGWESGKSIYTHTHNYLPASNYVYKVWLAGASTDPNNQIDVELRVEVGGKTVSLPVTITGQGWTAYELPFYTDGSSTTISIVQVGGHKGNAIFGIDDITIGNPVPKIITPSSAEVCVPKGKPITLTGEYKYVAALGDKVTYTWQKSTNGISDWTQVEVSTVDNEDTTSTPTYTTGGINETVYYRFMVSGSGIELVSNPIKLTPGEWPEKRTYWVCPDNIKQSEMDAEGYLPSLIDLAMPDLYVIYKWYTTETGGTPLDDIDDYQLGQERKNEIKYISDGKTNTISVVNDHSEQGEFTDRTYWVEVCQMDGTPYPDAERIPVYVRKAYICGSLDAVVHKDNSRLINRESFGGTSQDSNVATTPPAGIDVSYNFHDVDNNELPEGAYMLTKKSPDTNSGWSPITNHYYDYDSDENKNHGYLFMANANENPGRFYTHQLTNLGDCRNLELTFSGWFASPVNWAGSEKANLKFVLTDTDTNDVLAEFTTGNLIDAEIEWRQYGFKFFVPTGVTNITLEIINNNFGTTGGNDVVMDDIEIYLNIPPVTLVPDGDSYVCPNYTEISLKGQYYDDGTLGDYLDYRWEFEDPVAGWTHITYTDSEGETRIAAGSVQKGSVTPSVSEYFIPKFTDAHNGNYRLVVGQKGSFGDKYEKPPVNYDCVAVSKARKLTLITRSDRILEPLLSGLTAYCHDDEIEITNTEQNLDVEKYYEYEWQLDGKTIESARDYDKIVVGITLQAKDYTSGYHTLTLNVHNDVGCFYYSIHEFVIFPEVTTWTAKGDTRNWNDADNWSDGVPGYCTDVIIPNDDMSFSDGVLLLGHYPALKAPSVETLNSMKKPDDLSAYAEDQKNLEKQTLQDDPDFYLRPACDSIYFKMGGSVARTDWLNYNFAYVDLDIEPGRWYTLAAPLRSMYSGDYFVDGNVKRMSPTVFMMKYNAMNPQTKDEAVSGQFSNPFNTLTEELYSGLGFAVWVDEDGKKNELQPFRFPKDSTQYAIWNYHGIYLGKTGTLNRDNIGRFAYEEYFTMNNNLPDTQTSTSFEVTVTDDETMIVGNPFMSYLDFDKFIEANSGVDDGYYIWNGKTFDANSLSFSDTPNAIAPMQSFIVKKKDNAGEIEKLNFDLSMSIPAPSTPVLLRSAATIRSAAPSVLKLDVLRDGVVQSNIRIKYDPDEAKTYSPHKDMWTLFSADVTHPAVLYTLVDGKAASIHTSGNLSRPFELGIRTATFGQLTLRASDFETWNVPGDIYLEDRLMGILHDFSLDPEYTFSNQTGNVQGRFYLRLGDTHSDIDDEEQAETDISVMAYKNQIQIVTPLHDRINRVSIYSVQGQLLHKEQSVGQSIHTINLALPKQVVVVEVETEAHHKKQEKVIL